MGSRGEDPGALLVGEDTTQGQATGDPLGEGDHIRLDAELLEGEQAAGAADAGLDLVHQQQPVLLPAQGGQGLDHGDLQGAQAALPLDEFYHDRAHVVPRLGLDALQSGVGVAEGLVEGEEIVVIALLPGGGEGGDGPPMEGAVQGENGAAALAVLVEAVLPGHFDHGLIGLGPGVAEKDLVHSAAGAQLLGQQGPGLGIKQIGDMPQLPNLLCNGGHPLGVAISQGINPDAAGKVDVFPP